jgi:hypothetical protein
LTTAVLRSPNPTRPAVSASQADTMARAARAALRRLQAPKPATTMTAIAGDIALLRTPHAPKAAPDSVVCHKPNGNHWYCDDVTEATRDDTTEQHAPTRPGIGACEALAMARAARTLIERAPAPEPTMLISAIATDIAALCAAHTPKARPAAKDECSKPNQNHWYLSK